MVNDPRDEWMAAALRSRAEDSRSRHDCPHPERIWDAVRLQVPLDERLEIIDHLSECPTCAEAWSLAAELVAAHEQLDQPQVAFEPPRVAVPASSRLFSAFYGRTAVLVAAPVLVLIAFGIGFMVLRPSAGRLEPRTRPIEDVAAKPQPRDQQSTSLPREDFRLRWTPGPAGSRYDLNIISPDKTAAIQVKDLEVTEYQVPPERLAGMADGTTLFWRVDMHTPGGSFVSSDVLPVRLQQGTAPPASTTLTFESDYAAIRNLIAAQQLLMSKGRRVVGVQGDVQDVVLKVESLRIEGGTATARISRQVTVVVNGKRQAQISTEVWGYEKTAAGSWIGPIRADRPPVAADDTPRSRQPTRRRD